MTCHIEKLWSTWMSVEFDILFVLVKKVSGYLGCMVFDVNESVQVYDWFRKVWLPEFNSRIEIES